MHGGGHISGALIRGRYTCIMLMYSSKNASIHNNYGAQGLLLDYIGVLWLIQDLNQCIP